MDRPVDTAADGAQPRLPPRPGPGRRLASFVIDSALSVLVALAFTRPGTPAYGNAVFLAYAAQKLLLTALTGATIGQRVCGLEVRRDDGRPVGLRAVVRTALLLLVIPVVVIDREGRGLHDRLAGTRLVHRSRSAPR